MKKPEIKVVEIITDHKMAGYVGVTINLPRSLEQLHRQIVAMFYRFLYKHLTMSH